MARVIESKRRNRTLVLYNLNFFIGSVEKSCFAKEYTDNKNEILWNII
jgi:hypothetical protein